MTTAYALTALVVIHLVVVHIAAAMYHHFIKRDDVAARMIGPVGQSITCSHS